MKYYVEFCIRNVLYKLTLHLYVHTHIFGHTGMLHCRYTFSVLTYVSTNYHQYNIRRLVALMKIEVVINLCVIFYKTYSTGHPQF